MCCLDLYSLVTILKGMKNLLPNTNKELRSKKVIAEIRASNRKYTDRKTRCTVQDWIKPRIDQTSTSEKNDSGKEFGGTLDKEEGKKVRKMLQETPEPDCSNKEKRPSDTTETSPLNKVRELNQFTPWLMICNFRTASQAIMASLGKACAVWGVWLDVISSSTIMQCSKTLH